MAGARRCYGHNIWFMLGVATLGYFILNLPSAFLAIMIGILSHLLADSFTVTGVNWLYPYGGRPNENLRGKSYFRKGPYNMSTDHWIEKIIQPIILGFAGYLFLSKGITIEFFSIEGIERVPAALSLS